MTASSHNAPSSGQMPTGAPLEEALAEWSDILGAERVQRLSAAEPRYTATTLPNAPLPSAALKPGTSEEVVEIVKVAARHGVPLYPISRGRNWGYGDARPAMEGQVLVDLAGMNRILDYDETLASVTIEPGVSQGQLSDFLREQGDRLWMDCTGAGPQASVVGNVLERGFGHSLYGNRVQQIACLEAVLADGRVLRTGFGHYREAQSHKVFADGLGPALQGLFAQSNFGIVTRLTLWLMPRPERLQVALLSAEDPDDLPAIVELLRGLRLGKTLRSVVHIGNDLRVLSGMTGRAHLQAPWESGLTAEARTALRARYGMGAWTLSAGLYGTAQEVKAARSVVGRTLRGPGRRLLYLDRKRLGLAKRALAGLKWTGLGAGLREKLEAAEAVIDLHSGKPSARFLKGAYWRHRHPPAGDLPAEADPALDGCGIMWLAPVLPMTGVATRQILDLIEPLFARFGFDPLVTFSTVNERALAAVLTVAFDREDAAERDRARDCHDALLDAVLSAGFPPYRVGLRGMGRLEAGSETFWPIVRSLKLALDPGGIIAPGRYDGRPEGEK